MVQHHPELLTGVLRGERGTGIAAVPRRAGLPGTGGPPRRAWSSRRAGTALALLLAACSSGKVKPDPVPEHESRHKAVDPLAEDEESPEGMSVDGTLGTLDESAVQAGLGRVQPEVERCFSSRLRHEPYLGGKASVQIRVARDGQTKRAAMTESSLGSVEVERCVVAALRQARFERPRGGEAELTYPLTFQGKLAPVAWDPGMVREEIEKHRDRLTGGTEVPEGLVLTFYVDRRGAAVSAGMTAAEEIPEEFATRLIEALKQIKFVEPAGAHSHAKVTVPW